MKRKNLFVGLLLVLMTFNTLHAYVIDALDNHACGVNEYVHDFSTIDEHVDGDICHMHAVFHTAFILQEYKIVLETIYISHTPAFSAKIYNYNPHNNFLKPPIFS